MLTETLTGQPAKLPTRPGSVTAAAAPSDDAAALELAETRLAYTQLVRSCQAVVAAARLGDPQPGPIAYLHGHLGKVGLLPDPGTTARQIQEDTTKCVATICSRGGWVAAGHAAYAQLLGCGRWVVAAAAAGEAADAIRTLEAYLRQRGLLPPDGTTPARCLATAVSGEGWVW